MRYGLLGMALLASECPAAFACPIFILPGIAEQTVRSEIVIVGSTSAYEREYEETPIYKGVLTTAPYTVAVVKVETAIRGIKSTTHIRVGFVVGAQERGRGFDPERSSYINFLQQESRYLLFLKKHPVGNFYVFDRSTPPLPITFYNGQTPAIREAVLAAGAIADPMHALGHEDSDARALAATVLLQHYGLAGGAGPVTKVPLDKAESDAILSAIAGGDWTTPTTGHQMLRYALSGLNIEAAGWREPAVKPGENGDLVARDAFREWLAGPGTTFRINRFVPKFGPNWAGISVELNGPDSKPSILKTDKLPEVLAPIPDRTEPITRDEPASIVADSPESTRNEATLLRPLFLVALLVLVPSVAVAKRAASRTSLQSAGD